MSNTPLGLLDSLLVTVIGMAIVFMGLVILIFLIRFLGRITKNMGRKKVAISSPAPLPAVFANPVPITEGAAGDDALIAAITAAVACMLKDENHTGGFTVKHVRRISHAPAWQREGRETQIHSVF